MASKRKSLFAAGIITLLVVTLVAVPLVKNGIKDGEEASNLRRVGTDIDGDLSIESPEVEETRADKLEASNDELIQRPRLTGMPSSVPSPSPSLSSSEYRLSSTLPILSPSGTPSDELSEQPPAFWPSLKPSTSRPTIAPTLPPTTQVPSRQPTSNPSPWPTGKPTGRPTRPPSEQPVEPTISYLPGDLTVRQLGLLLSTGLEAKIIARSGHYVPYSSSLRISDRSSRRFHALPDLGDTFVDTRSDNHGGWVYVSNSEIRNATLRGKSGVGAIAFDKYGNVKDYRMVLTGTSVNCGGGRTPWNSWISCEEYDDGQIWEVDPLGERAAKPIAMSLDDRGFYESFAYDEAGRYYVTEDHEYGPLRRFIPDKRQNIFEHTDPWNELHGTGSTTFLQLHPESDSSGTFDWTMDKQASKNNAFAFYRNAEGIDVVGSKLYFVSKHLKTMFVLDLDTGNYTAQSTRRGLFDGQPDQIVNILGHGIDELFYFTEDGGTHAGVHARDATGRYYTILEGVSWQDETTGLAFSPNLKHMYVAFQEDGLLFDITRSDGQSFAAQTLNIKYH